MDPHHPLVRSVLLPLALALAGTGLLRVTLGLSAGRRWAAAALGLALWVAAVWTLGLRWPPSSLPEKLPWVYGAACLLALALEALRANARTQWAAAAVLWALVLLWFGRQPWVAGVVGWAVGVALIGALVHEPRDGAQAPALLLVAAAGLALVAMLSGSLLLFELALALVAALAGCALWLWPKARIGFGAGAGMVAALAWLALAQGTALLTRAPAAALLLLAGAGFSGLLLRAARRRRAALPGWIEPLASAALALLWVAAALALTLWLGADGSAGSEADDPYYRPAW